MTVGSMRINTTRSFKYSAKPGYLAIPYFTDLYQNFCLPFEWFGPVITERDTVDLI